MYAGNLSVAILNDDFNTILFITALIYSDFVIFKNGNDNFVVQCAASYFGVQSVNGRV